MKNIKPFYKEVVAPKSFIVGPHPSHKSNELLTFFKKIVTELQVLGESTQHSDRTELYIGLMKTGVGKDMRETNSPMLLWFYACERRAVIITLTVNNIFQLQVHNPCMQTLGEMGYISNLCQFGCYEWVYFRQKTSAFPFKKEDLCRCLGPTKNDGNEMCQWVLQQNG